MYCIIANNNFICNFGVIILYCRKLGSRKSMDNNTSLKCAMDHILEAQEKGEINEDNVLYIVENINVAGNFLFLFIFR